MDNISEKERSQTYWESLDCVLKIQGGLFAVAEVGEMIKYCNYYFFLNVSLMSKRCTDLLFDISVQTG